MGEAAIKLTDSELRLSDDQQSAIEQFKKFIGSKEKFMSLIGPAGSGKSTIVKKILAIAESEREVLLTAPTHKAAQNLREIADADVGTIHSLLCVKIKTDFNNGSQKLVFDENRLRLFDFEDALVVIDESSMLGCELLHKCKHIADSVDCKFLFVGDSEQLKPIGEPDSIAVNPNECPWRMARLTKVHRQASESPVLGLATAIRLGEHGLRSVEQHLVDGTGVHVLSGDEWRERVINDCSIKAETNRAVSFTNDYTHRINTAIRKAAYPDIDDLPPYLADEIMISNSRLAKDDSTMAENNEEIQIITVDYNERPFEIEFTNSKQEIYRCNAFCNFSERKAYLDKKAKKCRSGNLTWKEFYKESDMLSDFRPIYSSTVHKSQGSTYENVYINLQELAKCRDPIEHRRLLYVALTRASKSAFITY